MVSFFSILFPSYPSHSPEDSKCALRYQPPPLPPVKNTTPSFLPSCPLKSANWPSPPPLKQFPLPLKQFPLPLKQFPPLYWFFEKPH